MYNLIFVSFISTLFFINAISQTTVVFQPNANNGKDAYINSNFPNTNYGSYILLSSGSWTWSGDVGIVRSFVEFNLSSIPTNAIVTSAKLSFYNNDEALGNLYFTGNDHSNLTASNASFVSKVTSTWDENLINWNNQPSYDAQYMVPLSQSINPNQNYLDLDVLNIVQDMVSFPATNYGFILRMQTEDYYAGLLFASSDYVETSSRPKLEITYLQTCNTDCTMGSLEIFNPQTGNCEPINTIAGCTNELALNYNANANCDNGSCFFCIQALSITGVVLNGVYNADDIITSNGQIITSSSGPVAYHAGANFGEFIELQNGFFADGSVNFEAVNIQCDFTD